MAGQEPVGIRAARRILELRREGEAWNAFADRIGLSPQLVSNYRKGHHGASLEAIATVSERTRLPTDHFILDEGVPGAAGQIFEAAVLDALRRLLDKPPEHIVALSKLSLRANAPGEAASARRKKELEALEQSLEDAEQIERSVSERAPPRPRRKTARGGT